MTTETNPAAVINAVRARQGREPVNPFMIEGFGDGDAPPPMADLPDSELDPLSAMEQSPLIPQQAPPPIQLAPQPQVQPPGLVIVDGIARFNGTEAELDEADQKAVATIVLRAAQRRFNAQLFELTGKKTRRQRSRGVSAAAAPVRKRAGRRKRNASADAAATQPQAPAADQS